MSTDCAAPKISPTPVLPAPPALDVRDDTNDLEGDLNELRTRLRTDQARHSKELTQFAYAVSHDLREPLRMVASYAQLLSRRCSKQLDADGRDFLQFILEGAQTMDQLLGDLLNYSQQLRPLESPPSTVDSDAVARGVLMNLEKRILESGAQITCDALPAVQSDFIHLSQVFQQLITNSIRFRGPDPPCIHISATQSDGKATFSFLDNGLGIDPRYHEEIFNAFKRLQGREYPGTGVGLAICKRIIERYGGKIWVESEEGHGAIFRFTLPS
jgi:light-regulated signal transduction histidine kinase (bacteriophytochrome)